MAINGTVQVTGMVAPTSEADSYPTHYAGFGKGGHRSVDTLADMIGIPIARREEGMTVYVKEVKSTYILDSDGAWSVESIDKPPAILEW